MQADLAKGVAILSSLAITISVGVFASPSFSDMETASWQPRDAAFSIWAIIYTAIAIGGVFQLVPSVAARSSPWAAALLSVSLLCSTAWLVTVRRNKELSALLIVAAFITSLMAVALNSPLKDPCSVADRTVSVGPALLAGWLSLAAPLGINLAVQSRGGKELPWWVALPSAFTAAIVGGCSGTPEMGAVFVWAAIFGTRVDISCVLGTVGLGAALAAIARSLNKC